jgi:hypothetical protein
MLANLLAEGCDMTLSSNRHSLHSGTVLLLAMVFLLLLAILAGTLMQTGILELRMAANNQFREQAFQKSQAIASALSQDVDNFLLVGDVGFTLCKNAASGAQCDKSRFITLDSSLEKVPQGVKVNYQVVRMGPLITPGLPMRESQGAVSSLLAYDAAVFEVQVELDGGSVNLGSAEVVQGIAVLVASSQGMDAE